jgi:hypothetical protein
LTEINFIEPESDEIVVVLNSCYRIISELPRCTQQLLVLLFGTFRAVSLSSSSASVVPSSGMSSEALGVSVSPSFLHTCVGAGRQATMDDVIRFKVL